MTNTLRDKFKLKPEQFWCKREGYRQRVTLDHCFVCDHQDNCADYRVALAELDEDDPDSTETEDFIETARAKTEAAPGESVVEHK